MIKAKAVGKSMKRLRVECAVVRHEHGFSRQFAAGEQVDPSMPVGPDATLADCVPAEWFEDDAPAILEVAAMQGDA